MNKNDAEIKALNKMFNHLAEELFEEVLCDKCRRSIKLGMVKGKIVDIINNETLFLCPKCTEKIREEIKQF